MNIIERILFPKKYREENRAEFKSKMEEDSRLRAEDAKIMQLGVDKAIDAWIRMEVEAHFIKYIDQYLVWDSIFNGTNHEFYWFIGPTMRMYLVYDEETAKFSGNKATELYYSLFNQKKSEYEKSKNIKLPT